LKKLLFFFSILFLGSCLAKHEPMYFITMRKSGTHLLEKYLRLLLCPTDKKDDKLKNSVDKRYVRTISYKGRKVYFKHLCNEDLLLPSIPSKRKKIVLLRDPRDVLVSSIYFFPTMPQGKRDKASVDFIRKWDRLSIDRKITSLLTEALVPSMRVHVGQFTIVPTYLSMENTLLIYFEDLVGSQGGGSDERQFFAMEKIAEFIGADFDDSIYQKIKIDLFGSSKTFRSGKIGSWKAHFTDEHKTLFKKYYGDLLITMGYEEDYNW